MSLDLCRSGNPRRQDGQHFGKVVEAQGIKEKSEEIQVSGPRDKSSIGNGTPALLTSSS
jgi:hypothetical protein